MPNLSLGTIEVLGLPAAVEAADVALKTADVQLIGYETTDGMGMVAVKIEGQVSAVQSAVAAARAAAERITKVFAVSVIARPSDQLEPVVLTELTVGLSRPKPDASEPDKPQPDDAQAEPAQPAAEPAAGEPPAEPVIAAPAAEPAIDEPAEPVAAAAANGATESIKPRARSRRPAAES